MAKKQINVGLKLKNMNISLDSNVIRKALPKNKKLWPGLKKGSGQLPGVGLGGSGEGASESLAFARSLLGLLEEAPALEDITAEKPVTGDSSTDEQELGELEAEQPGDGEPIGGEMGEEAGIERFVRGAHLVYKREVDSGQFEELWIYSIDPNQTRDDHNTPLKAILAGTDIPENATRSEDGNQSYSLWTAGNAQYVHIKGLSN